MPGSDRLLGIIRTQTEIAKLGLDLGGVMSLVAERAQGLTDADGAVVELAEGEEMVYRAVCGLAEAQLGLRIKRKGSLSGLCVEKQVPLRCDDTEADDRVDLPGCRRVGMRSMLVVPLQHNDVTVGVLKVISRDTNAFADEDAELLLLMSEVIGAAMYFATNYEVNALFQRATHDPLTGLANRSLFFDRLRFNIAQAARNSHCIGIVLLDMDGLKSINDTYGHRTGDAALRALATRIEQAARQSDTTARIGGDEFGVILSRIDGRSGAERAVERMTAVIQTPFTFEEHAITLRASIGVALCPDDGYSLDLLLDTADKAMYAMKKTRSGR